MEQAMLVVFTSTITQRTWIGICVTVGHTIWECAGRPLPTHKGMCGQTPPQGIGLVRASPQGQLQGIVENCASILAQWKDFCGKHTSWCEGQGFVSTIHKLKWECGL